MVTYKGVTRTNRGRRWRVVVRSSNTQLTEFRFRHGPDGGEDSRNEGSGRLNLRTT